jgi:hypothetical protein
MKHTAPGPAGEGSVITLRAWSVRLLGLTWNSMAQPMCPKDYLASTPHPPMDRQAACMIASHRTLYPTYTPSHLADSQFAPNNPGFISGFRIPLSFALRILIRVTLEIRLILAPFGEFS